MSKFQKKSVRTGNASFAEVLQQPDPEAQEIAPAAELITAHRSHGQSGSAAFCREQRTGENI